MLIEVSEYKKLKKCFNKNDSKNKIVDHKLNEDRFILVIKTSRNKTKANEEMKMN